MPNRNKPCQSFCVVCHAVRDALLQPRRVPCIILKLVAQRMACQCTTPCRDVATRAGLSQAHTWCETMLWPHEPHDKEGQCIVHIIACRPMRRTSVDCCDWGQVQDSRRPEFKWLMEHVCTSLFCARLLAPTCQVMYAL